MAAEGRTAWGVHRGAGCENTWWRERSNVAGETTLPREQRRPLVMVDRRACTGTCWRSARAHGRARAPPRVGAMWRGGRQIWGRCEKGWRGGRGISLGLGYCWAFCPLSVSGREERAGPLRSGRGVREAECSGGTFGYFGLWAVALELWHLCGVIPHGE